MLGTGVAACNITAPMHYLFHHFTASNCLGCEILGVKPQTPAEGDDVMDGFVLNR